MMNSELMTPEQLVPLALALSPKIDRYADGPDVLLAAPPHVRGIAHSPLIESWCVELVALSDSADVELALAGLRAVRWLAAYRADRGRQLEVCDALGIDHSELADVEGVDLHFGANQPKWRSLSALVASADVHARSGDLRRSRSAVVTGPTLIELALSRERSVRAWLWPWERLSTVNRGSWLRTRDALPIVYPADWSPGWSDHYGRGGEVSGECVVILAEDAPPPAEWPSFTQEDAEPVEVAAEDDGGASADGQRRSSSPTLGESVRGPSGSGVFFGWDGERQ